MFLVFLFLNYSLYTYRQNHSTEACDLIHKKRKDVWERILFNELKIISYSYAMYHRKKYMLWFFILPFSQKSYKKHFGTSLNLQIRLAYFSQMRNFFFSYAIKIKKGWWEEKINSMASNWNQRLCRSWWRWVYVEWDLKNSIHFVLTFRSTCMHNFMYREYYEWDLRGEDTYNY